MKTSAKLFGLAVGS